ncbi:MAG: hypothetical protein DRQ47_04860, partial [Gammaproteobacteria bacterium]
PREMGCAVRPGSVELAHGLLDDTGNPGEVRTLMTYAATTGAADNLEFACTDAGIYDVTLGGSGPWVPMLPWDITGGNAGWCSFVNWTNLVGDHWLLVCDEANGYWIFDGTDWSQGSFSGGSPDPVNMVQISEWSNRLLFVERDTATAWYLDVGDLAGQVAPIDLGNRFIKGGYLVQILDWTIDDGEGMDDKLVVLSSGGDFLAFSGINPDVASEFVLDGRWFIGAPPVGRRAMSSWAGDVMITTSFGVVRASSIIAGRPLAANSRESKNITRYFRTDMRELIQEYGWQAEFSAQDGFGVFSVPRPAGDTRSPHQYCLNIDTGAWSVFRDLDIRCMEKSVAGFHFGDKTGSVWNLTGALDNVTLAGSESKTIWYSFLTHYDPLDAPSSWKQVQFVRPAFVGTVTPAYRVDVFYDFDLTTPGGAPPLAGELPAGLWDVNTWDQANWAGALNSQSDLRGASGMGRHVAIAMSGQAGSILAILGMDVVYTVGGML